MKGNFLLPILILTILCLAYNHQINYTQKIKKIAEEERKKDENNLDKDIELLKLRLDLTKSKNQIPKKYMVPQTARQPTIAGTLNDDISRESEQVQTDIQRMSEAAKVYYFGLYTFIYYSKHRNPQHQNRILSPPLIRILSLPSLKKWSLL